MSAEIVPVGGCGPILEDSTKVYYTFDGVEYLEAPMSNVGGDTYEGYIQPSAGKVVDYYLRSVSDDGVVGIEEGLLRPGCGDLAIVDERKAITDGERSLEIVGHDHRGDLETILQP